MPDDTKALDAVPEETQEDTTVEDTLDDRADSAWPEEREWPPEDARWGQRPTPPIIHNEVAHAHYDRGKCPIMPTHDYVVLRLDSVNFLSLNGVMIGGENQRQTAQGAHAPVLTVVSCGPDVKDYEPGNRVITNPRNSELVVEWSDPRPPHKSITFCLMKAELIMALYDGEVIDQLKLRAKYWEGRHALVQAQAAEAAAAAKAEAEAERKISESPLHPNADRELLDAQGDPLSKTGMQDDPLQQ